jgi:cell wall-associated NlpC family hydrolase
LRDAVQADQYVEGVEHQVVRSVAALHEAASPMSRRETELLFGETINVFDAKDGFAWGQAIADSYVGYLDAEAIAPTLLAPTHRVTAVRTITFSEPDIKSAPVLFLSLNAKLTVEEEAGLFLRLSRGGFALAQHAAPIGARAEDFVSVAELFLETPYLWGGKGARGIDCSGLVQAALETAGVRAPRDSDMQEAALGAPLPDGELTGLKRGDLIFWDRHVGMMLDAVRLLHANGYHMKVAIEPLREAAARIERAGGGPITSIRRLTIGVGLTSPS